jgi:hypothetical protein
MISAGHAYISVTDILLTDIPGQELFPGLKVSSTLAGFALGSARTQAWRFGRCSAGKA